MKKIVVILLIVGYLCSIVGLNITVHKCGGRKFYTAWDISINGACKCNHKESKHKKRCCKDNKIIAKADKNDNILKRVILVPKIFAEERNPFYFFDKAKYVSLHWVFCHDQFPLTHSPPLYLLFGVFRI